MNHATLKEGTTRCRPLFSFDRNIFDIIHEFARKAVSLGAVEGTVSLTGNGSLIGIAKSGGRFDERLQHCPQIKGRTTDDLEHIGGGGLLLERFTQFIEQTNVFDSDYSLISKSFDE